MNVKPIRLFRPHRYYEGEPDVIDVYPVGFYLDIRRILMALRMGHWWDIRYRVRGIARSWRRRSYWNGYLAEVGHPVALCGHGWTRRRALLSLEAAELREAHQRTGSESVKGPWCDPCALPWPCHTIQSADCAEARLREVTGDE